MLPTEMCRDRNQSHLETIYKTWWMYSKCNSGKGRSDHTTLLFVEFGESLELELRTACLAISHIKMACFS